MKHFGFTFSTLDEFQELVSNIFKTAPILTHCVICFNPEHCQDRVHLRHSTYKRPGKGEKPVFSQPCDCLWWHLGIHEQHSWDSGHLQYTARLSRRSGGFIHFIDGQWHANWTCHPWASGYPII